jgi:ABC-2 type transport system ATP-binding protein
MMRAMPDAVILTHDLRRAFGSLMAVDGANLCVERGWFYGFLGPNGAGKSTTIKMLTGLLRPTSGRVEVLGLDFEHHAVEVKRRIGVVPEGLAMFERLTGSQFLNFVGRMYGLERHVAAERTAELLDFMELGGAADQLVADYSHGMKKKTALAAAVIHRPEILFLDEPFEGVDAVAAGTLKGLLLRFRARGGTIFLTSHVLEVVERLCTHIGIINHGRMVASASIEDLRAGVEVPGAETGSQTLEQIFLRIVGGVRARDGEISWI